MALACAPASRPSIIDLGPSYPQPYLAIMCGRITQKSPPNQLGLQIVSLIEPLHVPPRYNGAPGQEQWVIRQNP